MMTSIIIVLVGIIATVVVPAAADCLVGGDMMFVEGQSTGHIGLECLNSTHYDARASVCGPNGQLVDSEVVMVCPDSVPYCMQCGSRGVGAALCLSVPDLGNRNCDEDGGGVGGGGVGVGGSNPDEEGELVIDFNDGSTTPNNDSDGGLIMDFNDPDPIVDDNDNGEIVLIENDNDGGGCDMMCPMDVEECNDGTFVSRDPCNDCQFEECEDEGFLPENPIIGITQDPPVDESEPIEPFDLCDNPSDIDMWTINGGESSRPIQSKYCFEEYNDNGCGMDNDCLTECWVDFQGYSEDCVACFVGIHQCSMDNGCMESCSEDMTGEECLECNAPCIEKMFGCSGLPQVVDETITDPTLPELINPGEESTDSPTSSPKPSPLGSSGNASNETPSPVSTDNTFTFAPADPTPPTDRDNNNGAVSIQLRLFTVAVVVLIMMIV